MTDDRYTLTVIFHRELGDDADEAHSRHPGLALPDSLVRQLRDELQAAFDAGHLSGNCQVLGPPLGADSGLPLKSKRAPKVRRSGGKP